MNDAADQAFRHCEQRVREADKDRFLASLFAPVRYRRFLLALYAFDIEMMQVRDRITSPLPGEVRLQWWRDALTGTAHGEAGANPIAAALIRTVRHFSLPLPALLDLIDAHSFDLYDEAMGSIAEFERYAAATAAVPLRLAATILNDGRTPGHEQAYRSAGIASAIVHAQHALPKHAARGQRYLPADVVGKHEGATADLAAGRSGAPLRAAVAEMVQIAREHLSVLNTEIGSLSEPVLPAFLPVALIAAALKRMRRPDYDPLHPRPLPQWRRQWLLWRAARNPRRIAG